MPAIPSSPSSDPGRVGRFGSHTPRVGPLSGCRVLAADDDPQMRQLIGAILRNAGAVVTVVADGRAAVQEAATDAARSHTYDVVLLDMRMPVLDGYSTARCLRRDGYSGSILAVTSEAGPGQRERCLDAGCDDFLLKPVSSFTLVPSVETLLSRRSGSAADSASS